MSQRGRLFGWSLGFALLGSGLGACGGAGSDQEVTSTSEAQQDLHGRCAGPFNLSCGKGQYCSNDVGKCPGKKQYGQCATRPQVCYKIYRPVCGCDGSTYGNDCEAAAAGVSVLSTGECAPATGQFCGGFANLPCPKGQTCVDVPDDGCDPKAGGADCGGMCVPQVDACAAVRCKAGTHCEVGSDGSAACLPDTNPCAFTLCAVGTTCVADGTSAECVPIQCGDVICPAGTTCCNPLRSICTPPGMVCIQ